MARGSASDEQIERLYKEMFHKLYVYALRIMRDPSLAEEAVQNTFCIACERELKLIESTNPPGWLMNVLKNVIRKTMRERAKLAAAVLDALDENDVSVTDEIDVDTLYSDISKTEDFRLLKRVALDNCTILELSEELGVPFEACKKRVQRARARLRKKIQENE